MRVHHSVKSFLPKIGSQTLYFLAPLPARVETYERGLSGFLSWRRQPWRKYSDGGSRSCGRPIQWNSWKLNLEFVSSSCPTIPCSIYTPQYILLCLIKLLQFLFSRTKLVSQNNLEEIFLILLVMLLSSCCHVQLFCDPMDSSLPGSSVHGILQARILE